MKLISPSRAAGRIIRQIPLSDIRTSPFQPRKTFPEGAVGELAESIRLHGLLSPLLVRRVSANGYELIAGERRLRALALLGCACADCIVLSSCDFDCALISLVENLQREALHYLDEAEACRSILDAHPITQEKLARSLSLSPSALANRLRLLKLPPAVRSALRNTGLSERHARALLRLPGEEAQLRLLKEAHERRLSVKQLEERIERLQKQSAARPRISGVVRDKRIVVNAVLDTVRELRRIGVRADSRVEEREGSVEVIVTIHTDKAES